MTPSFTTAEQLHSHYRGVKYRVYEAPRLAQQAIETSEKLPEAETTESLITTRKEGLEQPIGNLFRWRKIVKHVGDRHGFGIRDILGKRRPNPLVVVRWEAYWLVKIITGMSYPHVAMLFGRDHTTVLHGIQQFSKLLADGSVTIAPEMAVRVFGEC